MGTTYQNLGRNYLELRRLTRAEEVLQGRVVLLVQQQAFGLHHEVVGVLFGRHACGGAAGDLPLTLHRVFDFRRRVMRGPVDSAQRLRLREEPARGRRIAGEQRLTSLQQQSLGCIARGGRRRLRVPRPAIVPSDGRQASHASGGAAVPRRRGRRSPEEGRERCRRLVEPPT